MAGSPTNAGIHVATDGPVLTITIDRPHVLGALDPAAHKAMDAAFDRLRDDPGLRVAIVTGNGRAFCVGSDLKARARTNADDHPPTGFAGLTHRTDLDKPVIAAVNGLAVGGGLEIVLACDLAIAAETAEFALPEPRVGLAAIGGGGLQRLARQIPAKHAFDLILTGRRIGAEEARAMGLVSRVVPTAGLIAEAQAAAADICAGAPLAIAASLSVTRRAADVPSLMTALAQDYPEIVALFGSEDAIEGQAAFNQKRPPIWRGR